MPREPLISIRDFTFRRDVLPFLLALTGLALVIAGRFWDALPGLVLVTIFAGSSTARRMEWRGRAVPARLTEASVFRQGIRALPRDVITLAVIAVTFPAAALVVLLMLPTVWAWLNLATGCLISLGALTALIIELRRRGVKS